MQSSDLSTLCCPRCQANSNIVVLRRDHDSLVFECHACLTLQILSTRQSDKSFQFASSNSAGSATVLSEPTRCSGRLPSFN